MALTSKGHRTGRIIVRPGLVFDSPFSRIEPTPVTVMLHQYAQAALICNRPEGPGVKVNARSSATCGPMSPGVLHARCDTAPGALFQGPA